MPKHSDPSDEETPEDSSSGSEEQNPQDGGVPEYEKQRQARIAHNRARLEALGLPKIASSLMGSAQNATKRKRKGKAKVLEEEDDDDEYRPEEASSSEDEANDEDEKSSSARKKKVIDFYLCVSGDFTMWSRFILLGASDNLNEL